MSRFVLLPGGTMPEAQTELAAGYDCFVRAVECVHGEVNKYYLGFSVEISPDHYGMIVPRSSIHKKNYISANSPGIIDPDYRDEVCFMTRGPAMYAVGERCCQFLLLPRLSMENGARKTTTRDGGFGSTGK